jgi:hypothetical protein
VSNRTTAERLVTVLRRTLLTILGIQIVVAVSMSLVDGGAVDTAAI